MTDPERLSLRQVAERLGWQLWETKRYMHELHDKHGGLLVRREGIERRDGKESNTKLYALESRLRELAPHLFAPDSGMTRRDRKVFNRRFERAERGLTQLRREVVQLRRHVKQLARYLDDDGR